MLIRDARRHNFFTVDNAILDKGLSRYALVTYLVLCRYANNETQTCKVLLATIADKAGCGRTNVSLAIKELETLGLISVNRAKDSSCVFTLLSVDTPIQNTNAPHSNGELPPFAVCTHNNTSNNKTETKEILSAVAEVFRYYKDRIGKSGLYTLTPDRQKKGVARLRECLKKTGNLPGAVEMMRICVDAIEGSDFHMARGKYQGQRPYNDWENQLFGSESKMEKWLEEAQR